MSPQYTTLKPYSEATVAYNNMRKVLENEDPRFRNIDRLLARAFIELQKQRRQQQSGIFTPRMDLCDDPEDPFITAMLEVPGMKPDHLSVRIENGQLIIEGERTGPRLHTRTPETRTATTPSGPSAVADAQSAITALYPIRELKYGKFRRNITLPPEVNATHVRSMLVEGMLTIQWPRDPSIIASQVTGNPHDASATNA
ncbi:hypothetical protein C8Q80DRAFT_1118445 [Daedaleopsis nitida]|nr:hypothetical protein C8Q80DRAFT_1118445 [Daedaleopsis nitida]